MNKKFDFLKIVAGLLSKKAGSKKFLRRPAANKILAQHYRFDVETSKAVIDKLSQQGLVKKAKRGLYILV